MKTIRRPAICIEQKGVKLFATFLTASELLECTRVDQWNPELDATDVNQGYQRIQEAPRVRRFAKFVMDMDGHDSICPTALLVSDRGGSVEYDPDGNEVTIDMARPVHLVDGQHRVAGLRYAIEQKHCDKLRAFPLPVIIVKDLDRIGEMLQFRTVNGTAKSVRTDLCNMILTKLEAARGEGAISEKEFWKVVCSRAIEMLNTMDGSPWKDRILMPNEKKCRKAEIEKDPAKAHVRVVAATSFITSLHPVYNYLADCGFLNGSSKEQADYLANIINEFWSALRSMLPEAFKKPGDYVIQKTPGLFALHKICQRFLGRMHHGRRNWEESQFRVMLEPCPEMSSSDYWLASKEGRPMQGAAAYGSMKGFKELADLLDESLKQWNTGV